MIKASPVRLGIACLTLASLGGCDSCDPEWPRDDPPEIESVFISPDLSLIVPGHHQEFEAIAVSTDGDRFDPMDYDDEGYEIQWEATRVSDFATSDLGAFVPADGVALSDDHANPVVAMVTDPELQQFILGVKVLYEGSEFYAQLVIQVEAVVSPPVADRVRVKPTPGIAGAVLNGCELTRPAGVELRTEKEWEIFEVTELKPLGINYTETACTRPAEFAVAAPAARLILNDGTAATQSLLLGIAWTSPLWTDAVGDELNADQPAWWLGPDVVDLHVYNYTGVADISAAMQVQLNLANKAFGESRVGINFNIDQIINTVFDAATAPIGSCLEDYVEKGTSAGGLGVDIASIRLNVVVLKGALPGASLGWTCRPFENNPGRVLFLDWSNVELPAGIGGPERPALLAHELGHVLAHDRPRLKNGWEHVGDPAGTFDGFQKSNVMHPKKTGFPRDHLTIGQGFRMNVDPLSWYQAETGIFPKHPSRSCGQEPYCSDKCPPLQRDVNEITPTVGVCPPGSSSSEESSS